MAVVYIALGTNLGDRVHNLEDALTRLAAQVRLDARSNIYETEPWGVTEQPRFLNMVVKGDSALTPPALLEFLKSIEREMGRTPTVRYGPRVIDLDILFYDSEIVQSPALTIPHPRLAERRFVLVPLAELAPDLVHPTLGLAIRELLTRLPDNLTVKPFRQ